MCTCIWLNQPVALGDGEGLCVLGMEGNSHIKYKEGLTEVVV